jgi:hypothetical protein
MVHQMKPHKTSKALRVEARVYSTATIDLRYYPDQVSRPDFVIPKRNAATQVKRGLVPEFSLMPGF